MTNAMDINNLDQEIVLEPSKKKFWLALPIYGPLGTLGPIVAAYNMMKRAEPVALLEFILIVLGGIAVFGLALCNILALVGDRGTLKISKNGVTIHTIFGNWRTFKWDEVEFFWIEDHGFTTRINMTLTATPKRITNLTIHSYIGMTHYQVVEIINMFKEKYSKKDSQVFENNKSEEVNDGKPTFYI